MRLKTVTVISVASGRLLFNERAEAISPISVKYGMWNNWSALCGAQGLGMATEGAKLTPEAFARSELKPNIAPSIKQVAPKKAAMYPLMELGRKPCRNPETVLDCGCAPTLECLGI